MRFASGLSSPVYLTAAPGDLSRVFVAENSGQIQILDADTGVRRPAPFLTLPAGSGLLAMTFHPGYASNGHFFVWYQDASGGCHLDRYTRSAGNPDLADAASVHTVLYLATSPGHAGGYVFTELDDPDYLAILAWIEAGEYE